MPKRSRKPKSSDPVQIARRIVDQATGVSTPKKVAKPAKATTKKDAADIERAAGEGMAQPQGTRPKKKPVEKRDPAAVALGRKGGLKGGKARAAKLTKEQLSESARNAARARWPKGS
jgi:hypothetical protein